MKKTDSAQGGISATSRFFQPRALAFVCIFAALGIISLLATHAANTLTLSFVAQDTTGKSLNGVYIQVTGSPPATGCSPINGTTTQITNGGSIPRAYFYCSNSYGRVTAISYSGYQLCPCSPIQIGTQYGGNYPANGSGGTIIMEADTPAPTPAPTPTPTPSPSPTPTPTPSKSSSTSSSSSSSTSTKSSSSSTPQVTVTPSSNSSLSQSSTTPSTNIQPATGDNGELPDLTSSAPNVPQGRSSTVTSSDNLVSVAFPKDSFDTDAYCSINQGGSNSVPPKAAHVIGPYSIDCTDSNGNLLTSFNQDVTVKISLPSTKASYTAYVNSTGWTTASRPTNSRSISFKLAKAQLFAAAAKKGINWGIIILDVGTVIILLLITGVILRLIRRRQYLDSPPPPDYNGGYQG